MSLCLDMMACGAYSLLFSVIRSVWIFNVYRIVCRWLSHLCYHRCNAFKPSISNTNKLSNAKRCVIRAVDTNIILSIYCCLQPQRINCAACHFRKTKILLGLYSPHSFPYSPQNDVHPTLFALHYCRWHFFVMNASN